jgi:DNA-binding IclR family transcriptional regulator
MSDVTNEDRVRVLNAIQGNGRREMTVPAIAETIEMPRTKLRRVVASLVKSGHLEHYRYDGSEKTYRPTV